MASSRTGLTPHLTFRRKVLARGKAQGTTNCPDCGVHLDYNTTRTPSSAEPDHIVPIARGGTNDPSNGRVICRRCNQSRGAGRLPGTEAPKRARIEASKGW